MIKDTLSEVLTRIRNAIRIKSYGVEVVQTRITKALVHILLKEGFIEEVLELPSMSNKKKHKPLLFIRLKYVGVSRVSVITNLQRISRPRLRIYINYKEIPKIFGGLGVIVLSTSQGLITDREAKHRKLGGELLCSVW